MAYEEYKKSGRCGGKLLYQLCEIGVPVNYVENVIIQGSGTLTLYGELFATYDWNEDNTPIFNFQHKSYKTLQQPELFTAYNEDHISAVTSKLFHFTRPATYKVLLSEIEKNVSYVTNKQGEHVDTVNFKPFPKTIGGQRSIEDKFAALKSKWGK